MSVTEFKSVLQSAAYKSWFAKLDKNIINSTVDKLRASQQVSNKTDFLITEKTVSEVIEALTGEKPDKSDIFAMLNKIASNSGSTAKNALKGEKIEVAGRPAIKFTNIAFDTISTLLDSAFSSPEMDEYLHTQTEIRKEEEKAQLAATSGLDRKRRNELYNKIDNAPYISLGSLFDKGHVISVATNLSKSFRDSINKSADLQPKVRETLITILDKYIKKLQEDDIASANLPNGFDQEIYASYIKSSDKYLVELQFHVTNRQSGSASLPIVTELRKLFQPDSDTITGLLSNSSLGKDLAFSKGSPSFVNLVTDKIIASIAGTPQNNKVYTVPNTLIAKKPVPVNIVKLLWLPARMHKLAF